MKTERGPHAMANRSFTPESFAAGCIAGAAGQLIGHPLDTLKVPAAPIC